MHSESIDKPLYVSKRLFRNLWQEYRVYADRIELRFWSGRKLVRTEDILDVEVRPPVVIGDLFRGKNFAQSFPLKLDLADLFHHIAIHRRCGWIKHVRFTPDNPDMFAGVCKSIMTKKEAK